MKTLSETNMITSKPNANKNNNDNEITKAIQSHKLRRFYADLVKNEKSINWLAYAAKLYRKSHSIDTPLNYMKSACIFRKFLLENANGQSLTQFIEAAKNDLALRRSSLLNSEDKIERSEDAEMLYETLDNFVTYCDAQRDFMPRTTRSHFYNTVEVLKYCKVKIDDQELGQITLPDPKVLRDEYPSDDEIKRIDENASLTVRAFRRVLNDTDFDPVDIAQRKVRDFNFNESPTRLSIDREKTGEPLTGFLTQITSDTAKLFIERKHLQPDDYCFARNSRLTLCKTCATITILHALAPACKVTRLYETKTASIAAQSAKSRAIALASIT